MFWLCSSVFLDFDILEQIWYSFLNVYFRHCSNLRFGGFPPTLRAKYINLLTYLLKSSDVNKANGVKAKAKALFSKAKAKASYFQGQGR